MDPLSFEDAFNELNEDSAGDMYSETQSEPREGHERLPPTIPACQKALLDLIETFNIQVYHSQESEL